MIALAITVILSLLTLAAACGGDSAATSTPAPTAVPTQQTQSSQSGESGSESQSGEHSSNTGAGEGSESSDSASGEHGEGSEESGGNEESATQYGPDDTYDQIRAGARLIISYNRPSNTFTGTVENTTSGTLTRVRVEVHLSNGIELGPTTPVDLAPGEVADVTLEASGQPFDTWSAHPEVG